MQFAVKLYAGVMIGRIFDSTFVPLTEPRPTEELIVLASSH